MSDFSYVPRPFPEDVSSEAEFPRTLDKDLAIAVRMIEERFRRHYPATAFYPLRKSVTSVGQDTTLPVGAAPNTVFDALYSESVDPAAFTPNGKEPFAQPHTTDNVDAARGHEYDDPLFLHARVQRENVERELKRLGFEQIRGILVKLPTSACATAGWDPQPGDRLIYDNTLYEVQQRARTGYWKNSNVRLYIELSAQQARLGS